MSHPRQLQTNKKRGIEVSAKPRRKAPTCCRHALPEVFGFVPFWARLGASRRRAAMASRSKFRVALRALLKTRRRIRRRVAAVSV